MQTKKKEEYQRREHACVCIYNALRLLQRPAVKM